MVISIIKEPFELIVRLLKYIKINRIKSLVILLIFILLSGIFEAISLATIIPFLTLVYGGNSNSENFFIGNFLDLSFINFEGNFLLVTSLFLFFILSSAILRVFTIYYLHQVNAKIGTDLSTLVYKKIIYEPYEIHIQKNSANLINAITSQIAETSGLINALLNLISSIIISLSIVISLLIIDLKVSTFIVFLFLFSYFLITKTTRKRVVKNGNIINTSKGLQIKTLQESLGSIRDIILDKSYNFFTSKHNVLEKKIRFKYAENAFLNLFPRYALETIGISILCIFAYLKAKSGEASAGIAIVGAFALGAQRLLPSMQIIYSSLVGIYARTSSAKSILEILDSKTNLNHEEKILKRTYFKKLNLIDVNFKYKGTNKLIIKDFNFEINKGESVGIVGVSGSGKSTLIDLIVGLLNPNTGTILFNNCDINLDSNQNILKNWQMNISYVPQTIFLSDQNIEENIALGRLPSEIDMLKIISSAKKAQIHSFIQKSPLKYKTIVGENGVKLSGGQRQRIGIARALYNSKPVLILDEATSALDSKTEELVLKNITNDPDKTLIMITHRRDTLKNFDKIIEIKT